MSVRPSALPSARPKVRLTPIREIVETASFSREISLGRCHIAIYGERPPVVAYVGRVSGLVFMPIIRIARERKSFILKALTFQLRIKSRLCYRQTTLLLIHTSMLPHYVIRKRKEDPSVHQLIHGFVTWLSKPKYLGFFAKIGYV